MYRRVARLCSNSTCTEYMPIPSPVYQPAHGVPGGEQVPFALASASTRASRSTVLCYRCRSRSRSWCQLIRLLPPHGRRALRVHGEPRRSPREPGRAVRADRTIKSSAIASAAGYRSRSRSGRDHAAPVRCRTDRDLSHGRVRSPASCPEFEVLARLGPGRCAPSVSSWSHRCDQLRSAARGFRTSSSMAHPHGDQRGDPVTAPADLKVPPSRCDRA